MNHKRATARGTRERVDMGPGGPANQRRQWARAVRLGPVLVARAPEYLRPQPTAGPHRGHTQLTRLTPAFPPQLGPKAQTEIGTTLLTANHSLPLTVHHRPDRRRPRALLSPLPARSSVKNTNNQPPAARGGNRNNAASQIDGLVGVGPWHLGAAATGRHER
jgi:hypothetical protein